MAKENTDVPEDVAVVWQVAANGGFIDVSDMTVVVEEVHAAEVSAKLAGAAPVLWICGATPGGVNSSCLGKYSRCAAVMLNDRPTYELDDAPSGQELAMWWTDGGWFVGPPDSKGESAGYVSVVDPAYLPERVASGWLVAADGGWQAAPELRCTTEAPADLGTAQTGVARALARFVKTVELSVSHRGSTE